MKTLFIFAVIIVFFIEINSPAYVIIYYLDFLYYIIIINCDCFRYFFELIIDMKKKKRSDVIVKKDWFIFCLVYVCLFVLL